MRVVQIAQQGGDPVGTELYGCAPQIGVSLEYSVKAEAGEKGQPPCKSGPAKDVGSSGLRRHTQVNSRMKRSDARRQENEDFWHPTPSPLFL